MNRIVCLLLAATSILFAQSPSFAQADSTASPSAASWNDLATGHSYWGIDLGLTGSAYIGSQNFLWSITTPPSLATYLPYNNLGSGIGFVGGVKAGFEVTPSFDIEAKLRFMTNHTSNQESHPNIYLDPQFPASTANATNNYSLTLSSINFAILGHVRLSDQFYGIAGFSASTLTGNSFSASQQVAGSYLRLNTHTIANVSEQGTGDSSLVNWFTGYRGDVQIGAGSVFRIGANNMLLDVELLAGIPLTGWLTKVADSSMKATASYWLQPTSITDPHLWYATLTVGLRFPYHELPPPPPPEPTAPILPIPASAVAVAPQPIATDSGIMLSGHVTDANTGQPVSADLTAVDLSNNQVFAKSHSDSSGNYAVRVKGQGKYSVTANAPDHIFGTAYFEVDSEGRILKSHSDISLGGLKGGKTRMLIFFDFDKANLQTASTPELNQAVALMQTVSTLNVEIAGYSDSLGALQHNMDLSLRRAKAVRDYLIHHGIASERISAAGYGPMPPIAPNNTDEGRAENRRAEFVVKEK
jgi:outer membrane protein OmpA-like peptidoglycan-associated protein